MLSIESGSRTSVPLGLTETDSSRKACSWDSRTTPSRARRNPEFIRSNPRVDTSRLPPGAGNPPPPFRIPNGIPCAEDLLSLHDVICYSGSVRLLARGRTSSSRNAKHPLRFPLNALSSFWPCWSSAGAFRQSSRSIAPTREHSARPTPWPSSRPTIARPWRRFNCQINLCNAGCLQPTAHHFSSLSRRINSRYPLHIRWHWSPGQTFPANISCTAPI